MAVAEMEVGGGKLPYALRDAPAVPAPEHEVVRFGVEPGDEVAEELKELLAAALLEDQSVTYFARHSQHHQLGVWRAMVRLNFAAARTYSEAPLFFCTADRCGAALCFLYPQQQVNMWQYIRLGGLAPLVRHMRPSRWCAAIKHQTALDREKDSFQRHSGPYLHVFLMGVAEDKRRKGRGSALLQRIAAEADARGLPCYLEASSERSHALYLRHGYHDMMMLRPEAGKPEAPVYYIMQRPASQAGQ